MVPKRGIVGDLKEELQKLSGVPTAQVGVAASGLHGDAIGFNIVVDDCDGRV